ncbi:hypothetical protein Tco_1079796 [Tanacetum coccineum]|uniref:RRM domain-containing protein n=1 Tax=Tanacetum coccineum TaxID=301880 RepID=A0ABQ5HSX9_9ASTR
MAALTSPRSNVFLPARKSNVIFALPGHKNTSSVGRKLNAIFGRKLKIDMAAYGWKVRTSPRRENYGFYIEFDNTNAKNYFGTIMRGVLVFGVTQASQDFTPGGLREDNRKSDGAKNKLYRFKEIQDSEIPHRGLIDPYCCGSIAPRDVRDKRYYGLSSQVSTNGPSKVVMDGKDFKRSLEEVPLEVPPQGGKSELASEYRLKLRSSSKAKIKWYVKGDENTKFFNRHANKKRSQLNIQNAHIDMPFPNSLSTDQQKDLECMVSKEEVKRAVWDCGTDKSPGPDGFTFGFYPPLCRAIENDVILVNSFRSDSREDGVEEFQLYKSLQVWLATLPSHTAVDSWPENIVLVESGLLYVSSYENVHLGWYLLGSSGKSQSGVRKTSSIVYGGRIWMVP